MKYHYVYRITNIVLNKHYYGTRSSVVHPIEDIGLKYFSSSRDKNFLKDQKDNTDDYKYKVIKIFTTRKEAMNLEVNLHKKFNVGVNEAFYNKARQTSTGFDRQGILVEFTEEWKENLKGPKSAEHRKNASLSKINGHRNETIKKLYGSDNPMYGKDHSDEAKAKISKANKGKILSEETKAKMSLAKTGIKRTSEDKAKMSENRKGKGAGKDNGMVKTILIYDNNNELIFEVQDGFKKFCKTNKLPGNAFFKSYSNEGSKIYQTNVGILSAERNGFEEYIGWYAKIK